MSSVSKITFLFAALSLTACETGLGDRILDPSDRSLIETAVQTALENNRTGTGSNWTNPATGNVGTVVPVRTFKSPSGADCRGYQQVITVNGKADAVFDTACRDHEGRWRSVNHRSPADAWPPRQYGNSYDPDPHAHYYGSYGVYRHGYGHGYRHGYRSRSRFSVGVGTHFHF